MSDFLSNQISLKMNHWGVLVIITNKAVSLQYYYYFLVLNLESLELSISIGVEYYLVLNYD